MLSDKWPPFCSQDTAYLIHYTRHICFRTCETVRHPRYAKPKTLQITLFNKYFASWVNIVKRNGVQLQIKTNHGLLMHAVQHVLWILRAWVNRTIHAMPFAVPVIWKAPKDHVSDWYFYLTPVSGHTSKTKQTVVILIYPWLWDQCCMVRDYLFIRGQY